MKCQDVVHAIPLYLYGEVSPAMEEQLEDHITGCDSCSREFRFQKAVNSALDTREMSSPPGLLQECRGDLTRRIGREPLHGGGWFDLGGWFRDLMHNGLNLRVPVSAVALIAVGYVAARLTNPVPNPTPGSLAANVAGVESGNFSSVVRSIEPQSSGMVRVALDEVHRREVMGRLDDENIQRLLLEAVRQENNPGVRVESVGMLKECAQSASIRAALLDRVAHDPNAGVRLKALEGLKAFAGDSSVRQTLEQVLLHDDNAGMRIGTIDLLISQHDDSMVGILQDAFQKEDNQHVRIRVQNALQQMHASLGTF